MRKGFVILLLAALTAISLSCGKTEDRAVARIGGEVMTVGMITDQYLAISPQNRPDLKTIDEKEQFARDVISKEILLAEARKIGLDRLPEVIEARNTAVQRQAWQVFYEEQVRSKVSVTDEEIQELYGKQGHRYDVSWIFLRSKALADAVSRRIKNGERFEDLALIYSMDASKERGGALGTRVLGTMPSNVEDIVMEMSPGDITAPITYETYYVIIRLNDRSETELLDFESLKDGLSSMVRSRKETEVQRNLVKEFQVKYALTFNTDVLDMIARKTAALHPSDDSELGQIPEFSDEELARTVAHYDGGEWRVRTYMERMNTQKPPLRPGRGADREMIQSVISDFITGELWLAEIRNAGYEELPEVAQMGNRALEEALVTAMHEDLVRTVEIDDEKMREFYDEQQAELVTEPSVRLAVITVATEEEAEAVHAALQGGASFEALAKERSLDTGSAERGGALMGPLYRRQIEQFPDLEELVDKMSEGEYSQPVTVPMGFVTGQFGIVKVLEKVDSRQMTFDEVKVMLSQRVLQMEQDRVLGEWLTTKMEEYDVETYPEVLGAIDFMELKGLES